MKKRKMITDSCQKRQSKTTKTEKKTISLAEFMKSIANDDLLLEIFTRLPNSRAMFSCAAVCKRWHSVISHPHFVAMFKRRRIDSAPPCTFLFKEDEYIRSTAYLFSYEAAILHGPMRSKGRTREARYLDFLPPESMVMASCKDLLVVQLPPPQCSLCICNPLTKQWTPLPEPRGIKYPDPNINFDVEFLTYEVGFVCNFDSQSHQLINYTVVLLDSWYSSSTEVAVFRSETGKWDNLLYRLPRTTTLFREGSTIGTSDGMLYHPLVKRRRKRYHKIYGFDPSDPEGCYCQISLPDGIRNKHTQLGVRMGKLCIWESYLEGRESNAYAKFVFKVWQLNEKYNNWISVIDVRFEVGDNYKMFNKNSFVKALHPGDDSIFYFMDDNQTRIHQYDIGTEFCKKNVSISPVSPFQMPYVLEHPRYPTLIPQL